MAKVRTRQLRLGPAAGNRRRARPSFSDALRLANDRARERTNRRLGRGDWKSVQAAIAATQPDFLPDYHIRPGALLRLWRWLLGLLLLPLCAVTTWTFFDQFTDATLEHRFWTTKEFWYFTTGCLLMTGWFFTGLLRSGFLYLYVLGHELTHILFIWLFRGRVSDWGVSLDGGFVTTDKSNIVIALSPYFVPLWAAAGVSLYAAINFLWPLPLAAEKFLLGFTGFFWAFHFLWTLWMIPRDQPDLKENGTFLSLTIIWLANQLTLAALLCLASQALGFRDFAAEWAANAFRTFEAGREFAGSLR